MTIVLYCLILSTAFDSNNKTRTLPPVFVEMSQTIWPRSRLKLCAIHFRRKNILWVAGGSLGLRLENVTAQLSPVSQKGWEEENQLSNLPNVSHLLPANSTNFS